MTTMTEARPRRTARRTTTKPAETATLDWPALIETALTMPGSTGDTYCRFYRYSFLNQVMLMSQGVREPVATFKRWRDMGRQVQRGSKAKMIVRPIVITREDDNGEQTSFRKFKPVRCLFTVSETEGQALPEPPRSEWSLGRARVALDVTEEPFAMLDGNVQGYSHGRAYAVSPVAVDPRKTTMHELAHIVLGHTDADTRKVDGVELPRSMGEFQAEAVAFLVMKELGELSERSESSARAYIQGWLQGVRPGEREIRAVFTATDKILRAGLPVAETEGE